MFLAQFQLRTNTNLNYKPLEYELRQIRWEFHKKFISTSSIKFCKISEHEFKKFNLDGKKRKINPNLAAPHTLKNRRTMAILGVALLFTVAAPKVLNDIVDYFEKPEK